MNNKTTPATAETITLRLATWSRRYLAREADFDPATANKEWLAIEADAVDWADRNQTPLQEQTKPTTPRRKP